MFRTVSNLDQVVANIEAFSIEVEHSQELQARLPYVRAWYVTKDSSNRWIAAGSKYCGYKGMTAEKYVAHSDGLDGRRTERVLAEWFTAVPVDDPLNEELTEWLHDYLEDFKKKPSALMRLNVTKRIWEEHIDGGNSQDDEALVNLIVAVARKLPSALRTRIKKRL